MSEDRPRTSPLGWSTADRVIVHDHDLAEELLGEVGFGAMAFLSLTRRLPSPDEAAVFEACLVTLVEHGPTPSSLATRLTLLGAPDSLQGAVAAGLLGVGGRFVGSIEGAAQLTQDAWAAEPDAEVETLAGQIVDRFAHEDRPVPGFGHPVHRPTDPRSTRLFEIAADHGYSGRHVELIRAVGEVLAVRRGEPLTLNATGAIGALLGELGLPWQAGRGIGVMARAVGLVGHVLDEMEQPMAAELWYRVDDEVRAAALEAAEESDR